MDLNWLHPHKCGEFAHRITFLVCLPEFDFCLLQMVSVTFASVDCLTVISFLGFLAHSYAADWGTVTSLPGMTDRGLRSRELGALVSNFTEIRLCQQIFV